MLDGRLPAGSRLPGSRALAESVGVSRNTVTHVYEVLSTEGYIEPNRQGTRVAALARPEPEDRTHPTPAVPARRTGRIRRSGPGAGTSLAFAPGVPAPAQFPLAAWRRSLDGVLRQGGTELLGYGPPQGEPALRTAVLRHLALARGMRCTPEQIVITSLRIGFLVLPEPLVDRAAPVVDELLRGGHRHEQLALAHFMESGQYSRHLARMRRLHRRRRDALRAALAEHFDVPHTVTGGDSGMHLTVRLPPTVPDRRLAAAARRHRMAPRPLSRHSLVPDSGHNGLVLGYGDTPESAFAPNLRRLADLVKELD
ncbi:aminotransferase class I/II-fold pyridoxal phosphate-dependent enzyme [Kitasatospora griseola]|uniref:aminotransferase class I/II-fold pyridoxal phosphate-dependent enzyme n=1 Tax=Kitasatospora griseola TaxID=2064 RepID=UPI0038046405